MMRALWSRCWSALRRVTRRPKTLAELVAEVEAVPPEALLAMRDTLVVRRDLPEPLRVAIAAKIAEVKALHRAQRAPARLAKAEAKRARRAELRRARG